MEPVFDFKISSNLPLSKACKAIDINTFITLCNYIKQLPYGRTKNRSDFTSIINEQKGTCSTKHAFLKTVAQENNQDVVKLFIGIYKMNNTNTEGVGDVLEYNNLEYIPEAHTYLKINNKIIDITRIVNSKTSFEKSLLTEKEIGPNQIANYKVQWHQNYIKQWIVEQKMQQSFNAVWSIREACIVALSE